jgi:hypothetical protein
MVWACDPDNWDRISRPECLPDQSTMSRRTRTRLFQEFLVTLARRLNGKIGKSLLQCGCLDGKPLTVAMHSKDRNAGCGYGAGQLARGYKLHAIWSGRPMPEQWAVTSLNVSEKSMARRMMKRLAGSGYLLADAQYDAGDLHEQAAAVGYQLVAPRERPGTGLGHRRQSIHRLRSVAMLEPPAGINDFGLTLFQQRKQIERDFGNLTSYGGGLAGLPSWVRRIWRVRTWVHAKLLVNAARIRRRHAKAVGA